MEFLRRVIGIAPSAVPSGGVAPVGAGSEERQRAILERHKATGGSSSTAASGADRLTQLQRAQEMQLDQLQEEHADACAALDAAVATGNRPAAGAALRTRRELEPQLKMRQGKLNNTRTQMAALQASHANVEQVLLIKEGAEELHAATQVVEQLDARGAMDRMQEGMAMLEEQNRLLTEPLGNANGISPVVEDYEAEAELTALMNAHAATSKLPSATAATGTVAATAPTPVAAPAPVSAAPVAAVEESGK